MMEVEIDDVITFTYKNWKGEISKRTCVVAEFLFGSNEWHKESQFLLKGFDLDKNEERIYAISDISELRVIE